MSMLKKRHHQILDMVKEQKTVSVSEIVEELHISEMTARRDLDFLEANTNMLKRFRGGARLVEDQMDKETSFLNERFQRQYARNEEAKAAMGKLAAELVNEGETIIIDAGSSALQLARHLGGKKNITAVVTAVNTAEELEDKEGIMKILTGGVFRSRSTTLISPFIEDSLTSIYADKVFIGLSGVSLTHGFTDNDILETDVKKILTRSGREIYWLADSSKMDNIAAFQIAKIEANHTVITDWGISPEFRKELEQKCKVLVAEKG